jgi:hypothetical protein
VLNAGYGHSKQSIGRFDGCLDRRIAKNWRQRVTLFSGSAAEQPQQGFQHAAQHFENIVDGRHHDWNQPRLSVNFLTARMIGSTGLAPSISLRRAIETIT